MAASLPIQHLPMKAVEIKPIKSGERYIYDLGQITSAYVLDLPITLHKRWGGLTVSGRIMNISRDGTPGYHNISIQPSHGDTEVVSIRTAS